MMISAGRLRCIAHAKLWLMPAAVTGTLARLGSRTPTHAMHGQQVAAVNVTHPHANMAAAVWSRAAITLEQCMSGLQLSPSGACRAPEQLSEGT